MVEAKSNSLCRRCEQHTWQMVLSAWRSAALRSLSSCDGHTEGRRRLSNRASSKQGETSRRAPPDHSARALALTRASSPAAAAHAPLAPIC